MATHLNELLHRVKAAQGGDAALACDIIDALLPNEPDCGVVYVGFDPTASIDSALALVERVLPGWHGALTWMPARSGNDALHCCEIGPMDWVGDEPPDNIIASAANPALAILAALLTALIAKENA